MKSFDDLSYLEQVVVISAFVLFPLMTALFLGDLTEVFRPGMVLLYFAAACSFILIRGFCFSGGSIRSVFVCTSKNALTFILSLFLLTTAIPRHNAFIEQNPGSVFFVSATFSILAAWALRCAVRYLRNKHQTAEAAFVSGADVKE